MTVPRWLIAFIGTFFLGTNVCAQLHQIDLAKLPQDAGVRTAYSNVEAVEFMAHSWSPTWSYSVPKTEVASKLSLSLAELRSAQTHAQQNEELLLLTGIVAHLAYNVDVDGTYQVAVQSFEIAEKMAPGDYRPEWFLASRHCQSNEIDAGMEQLLSLENRIPWQQLPAAFWDDYTNCSTLALMPAHTLRAIDHAVKLGEDSSAYSSAVDIARVC